MLPRRLHPCPQRTAGCRSAIAFCAELGWACLASRPEPRRAGLYRRSAGSSWGRHAYGVRPARYRVWRPGRGGTYLRWRIRTLLCERLFALSFQEKPSDSDLAGDHVFDCSYASLPDAEFDPGLSDGTETPRHMPHEPAHPLVLGPRVRVLYLQGLQLLASAHRDVQNATAVS